MWVVLFLTIDSTFLALPRACINALMHAVRRLSYSCEAGVPLQFQLFDPLTNASLPLPSLPGITVWLLPSYASTAVGTLDWPRLGSPPHWSLCLSTFSAFRFFPASWLVLNLHGSGTPDRSESGVAGLSLLIISSERHSQCLGARNRFAT